MKISRPRLIQIAKEYSAMSAFIETVLGSYVGVKYALGESSVGWLWLFLAGGVSWVSTRIWIWYFDRRMEGDEDART